MPERIAPWPGIIPAFFKGWDKSTLDIHVKKPWEEQRI
jgi:hypothetical protein